MDCLKWGWRALYKSKGCRLRFPVGGFLLYYGLSEMRMKSPIQFNGMQTQIPGWSNFWFKIVNYWVIKWPSRPTTTPCNKQDWQCICTLCGFEACNYIQQNVIRYSNNFHKCYFMTKNHFNILITVIFPFIECYSLALSSLESTG